MHACFSLARVLPAKIHVIIERFLPLLPEPIPLLPLSLGPECSPCFFAPRVINITSTCPFPCKLRAYDGHDYRDCLPARWGFPLPFSRTSEFAPLAINVSNPPESAKLPRFPSLFGEAVAGLRQPYAHEVRVMSIRTVRSTVSYHDSVLTSTFSSCETELSSWLNCSTDGAQEPWRRCRGCGSPAMRPFSFAYSNLRGIWSPILTPSRNSKPVSRIVSPRLSHIHVHCSTRLSLDFKTQHATAPRPARRTSSPHRSMAHYQTSGTCR